MQRQAQALQGDHARGISHDLICEARAGIGIDLIRQAKARLRSVSQRKEMA